jgi:quercetin dioxygenase-like cupin family protein
MNAPVDIVQDIATPAAGPSREQVLRLQSEMAKMPQIELPTDHFFSPGMYARRMKAPAGAVIVGKAHKAPHFFIVASGVIAVTTDAGVRRIEAGEILCAQPGTKRVGVAITDVVVINVHQTEETDLDLLELELIEPEEGALFDARNQLKGLPCPG